MTDRRAIALVALILVTISVLTGFRLAAVTGPLELAAQVTLIVSFALLAVLDLRLAVAIAVLELALGGASGRWTVFPGGFSGRLLLDGIVFAVALWRLVQRRRSGQPLVLGRYTVHAVAVGVLLAAIWIPLGVVNGWQPQDAWGDGNGYLFFAFALVLAALAVDSDLAWLRRWLLVACTAVAVLTAGLALMAVFVLPDFVMVRRALLNTLDQGGAISLSDDHLRLALGSGIYLIVGLALVTWEVVRDARRAWPWIVLLVIGIALLASYTRAFWLAAAVVVVLVALVGLPRLRGAMLAAAAGGALVLGAATFILAAGWSFPGYLYERIETTVAVPDDSGNAFALDFGVVSNAIKIHQARVLLGHIAERPIQGWGFGAIAPDYRYGQIYSYELSYLAVAYKTGIIGLLLFMSFPLRLVIDAVRVRLGRIRPALGVEPREAAVPIAVLLSLLAVGATNPYLVASFGLAPIVLMVCWLDPFEVRKRADIGLPP